MHIQVYTTGGTIDKVYFDAKSAFEVGEPQIGAVFREAGVSFAYDVETLFRKDSLELDDADRALVTERVLACEHDRILITHGTDTMARTAQAVAGGLSNGPSSEKVVVFVGSLAPARFKATDAEFNVGFAAAAVQTLGPGVYVAMNGRVFDPFRVRKDRDQNRFEPVTSGGAIP